jgi:hypothetical protein
MHFSKSTARWFGLEQIRAGSALRKKASNASARGIASGPAGQDSQFPLLIHRPYCIRNLENLVEYRSEKPVKPESSDDLIYSDKTVWLNI